MRALHLVGESLPTGRVVPVGGLIDLHALDARHGVFPNLVMTPLLATLHAFESESKARRAEFWKQVIGLLETSKRRLNAFTKIDFQPRNPRFSIHRSIVTRLRSFDPASEVWALFGYQTIFGVIRWLLKGDLCVEKKAINEFAVSFLSHAREKWTSDLNLPDPKCRNYSAREGIIHRLCTDSDPSGTGVVAMLRHAIERNTTHPARLEAHLRILRSFVPLLHNEAYQLSPYGVGQANFVLAADYDVEGTKHAESLYWTVVGDSLKRRILVQTAPTP